ncbi:MAG: hypothetical protein GTO60_02020, partial [Gammaproteobacteria bacterium]|nr:hypothetical protein [Gammaproteobacteria bacterium]
MNTRPLNEEYWISTSCHNIEELQRAEQLGLDFCIISPVKQTPSHPAARPMGWENFNALARETGIPVYALGGMHAEDLSAAR